MSDFAKTVAIKALGMKIEGFSTEEILKKCKMSSIGIRENLNTEDRARWDSTEDNIAYTAYIGKEAILTKNYNTGNDTLNKKKMKEDLLKEITIKRGML